MGWTHYWEREKEIPAEEFEKAVNDCELLFSKMNVPLAGPQSEAEPVFSPEAMMFNGVQGQDCEIFSMKRIEEPRRPGAAVLSYCKTEKLPYDVCVRAALVIMKHYLGDHLQVMSDGKMKDWKDAVNICILHLGLGDKFNLSSKKKRGNIYF